MNEQIEAEFYDASENAKKLRKSYTRQIHIKK